MPSRISLTGFADRLLGDIESLFGTRTSPLDAMSKAVTDLKAKAYADDKLTPTELDAIYAKLSDAQAKFAKYAASRGYPVGESRPTSLESFKLFQEQQE